MNARRRPRRDPIADAATKRLLRCPDCPARVRLEHDSYGDRTAFVEHEPSCPRIPAEHRARGEAMHVIRDPQLLNIPNMEGVDDAPGR